MCYLRKPVLYLHEPALLWHHCSLGCLSRGSRLISGVAGSQGGKSLSNSQLWRGNRDELYHPARACAALTALTEQLIHSLAITCILWNGEELQELWCPGAPGSIRTYKKLWNCAGDEEWMTAAVDSTHQNMHQRLHGWKFLLWSLPSSWLVHGGIWSEVPEDLLLPSPYHRQRFKAWSKFIHYLGEKAKISSRFTAKVVGLCLLLGRLALDTADDTCKQSWKIQLRSLSSGPNLCLP